MVDEMVIIEPCRFRKSYRVPIHSLTHPLLKSHALSVIVYYLATTVDGTPSSSPHPPYFFSVSRRRGPANPGTKGCKQTVWLAGQVSE